MRLLAIGLLVGLAFGVLVVRRVEVRTVSTFPPLPEHAKKFSQETARMRAARAVLGIKDPEGMLPPPDDLRRKFYGKR